MKPHKFAEVIKAWAEGKIIQFRTCDDEEWCDKRFECELGFIGNFQYRIKPELPKYPQTKMSRQDIKRAFHAANGETEKGWRGIANAAIARAIEDGQVYPADMVTSIKVDR